MTIEELLQSEDISKVVSELRNGRLSVEPNTKNTSRSTTLRCTI